MIVVFWAADLTAVIPLAVLAGIALKVGIDIIDWGFLNVPIECPVKVASLLIVLFC